MQFNSTVTKPFLSLNALLFMIIFFIQILFICQQRSGVYVSFYINSFFFRSFFLLLVIYY